MNMLQLGWKLIVHVNGFFLSFNVFCQLASVGRRKFGTDFQLMSRIVKGLIFLGFLSIMTVLFVVCNLTISDVFSSILAFMPTGWAILLVRLSFLFPRLTNYNLRFLTSHISSNSYGFLLQLLT